jgi:haloacetate dehalogenase
MGKTPDAFVNYMLDDWSNGPDAFSEELRAAYIDQFRDPARRHAICEQYRAAGTLDVGHDNQDAACGRKIGCPLLALWSNRGPEEAWYDPLQVWSGWADDVSGGPVEGGHFLPEEAPDAVTDALGPFLLAQVRDLLTLRAPRRVYPVRHRLANQISRTL